MSLRTIEQLLESVDLDFEPRFITQDEDGDVWIWNTRPDKNANWCLKKGTPKPFRGRFISECLKLAEFENKHWTECIYEVPQKTDEYEQNLEELRPADSDLVYRVKLPRKDKPVVKIEKLNLLNDSALLWGKKINELVDMVNSIISVQDKMIDSRFVVDAVNELKGAKNE